MRKKYIKKKTLPVYENGGQTKQEWILEKIKKLEHENKNRSHEQIIAIALNMANEKFQEGGQKKTLGEIQNLRLNPTLPPTTGTPLTFEEEQKTIAPQKPVERILYNVQTSESKQGLPEGNYTRVDYKDRSSDYLTPEGYENFRRMNNYRLYQEEQSKKLNQNPQLPPQYQKGGQTNPQLPSPRYGVESVYPIVYMDKATKQKQGENGIYEGYNAYYRDPSSPDFNPDSDVVFYTNDEFELKKTLKQPTSQAAGQYDPEINRYLAKTKGRVGQLVQYQNGGQNNFFTNWLGSATPTDFSGRPINKQVPTTNSVQPTYGINPSQWTPGTLPQTNFGQVTTNPQDITTSDQIVAQPTNGVAYPAPTFSRANPEDINVEIDGQQPYAPTQEDVIKQNIEATEGAPIQPTIPTNQQLGTTSPNNQPFQFFNPYGGVDLETSASVLGQGIANKDPLSIVGGALKLTTGLGRNIMGGLGAQRMQNQIMKNYAEQQRSVVTQENRPRILTNQGNQTGTYQEGGEVQGSQEEQIFMQVADMLQQGVTPEEIMGQLLQNGLSEQEATQILQMVIQELQAQAPQQEQAPQEQQIMQNGGEILSSLRGKKIKDYTYNKDKDTYTISYEE